MAWNVVSVLRFSQKHRQTSRRRSRPAVNAAMALAGKTFSLSAGGVPQAQLAADIKAAGGLVSNIVHKRVDFLVVTPYAIKINTQSVRKARTKFPQIVMVLPGFIEASIAAGNLLDPTGYDPATAPQESKKPKGLTLAEVGLNVGDTIEVLVEMADEPKMQWWPTSLEVPTLAGTRAHPIAYQPLPARDYAEPTLSRARFELPGPSRRDAK